jgi:CRISPR-associated endonuclease/helicase Cas3
VATQVIEVGLDISCDCLLTELAPIDALIQRAGRCARWGGEGQIVVYYMEEPAPYPKELFEKTHQYLPAISGKRLSWGIEKKVVDEVLGDFLKDRLGPEAAAQAFGYLAEAAFKGKPALAEKAVRGERTSVQITIHDDPWSLGRDLRCLPQVSVPLSRIGWLRSQGARLWWAAFMENEDYVDSPELESLTGSRKPLAPWGLYVVDPNWASYSEDEGLSLGKPGVSFSPKERPQEAAHEPRRRWQEETWTEHARNVVREYETNFRDETLIRKLARLCKVPEVELEGAVRFMLVAHDLGKLNKKWQEGVGGSDERPLAHTSKETSHKLPPHATVSAYILQDFLRETWGKTLGQALALAIAHHHSARSVHVPAYRMIDGWLEILSKVALELACLRVPLDSLEKLGKDTAGPVLNLKMAPFEKPRTYTCYVLLVRWLKLSDWRATGEGEDAILRFQDRFRSF